MEPPNRVKLLLLAALLACVPAPVLSRSLAEERSATLAAAVQADGAAQEKDTSGRPEDEPRRKKILVLHTLKAKRPWNVLFNRYFTEALQESGLSLANLDIENLDLLQFKDANYREMVKRQLKHKYANTPPDVIIITFASTIDFVLENNLFPGIPKIFVLPTPSGLDEIPGSVVLPFAFEFRKNIEHALSLLPDTKTIHVVAGNGLMDKRLVSMFRSDTEGLEKLLSFQYLDNLNVEELLDRLGRLPDDSFVYYLTYSLDFDGKAVITRDFSQRIGERANRPVLSWLDLHALNIDILGGRVTTTRASATMSLDIVKRILEGESIDSIQPGPLYVEYIYQWEELKKWGIDPGKLPPESVIQNRPYSFFEIFKWRIIGGIVLMAVQALLILFLLINIRRRKVAEQRLKEHQHELLEKVGALQQSEERYGLAVTGSAAGIWDWDIRSGKVFYSGRFKELLGYAADEPWSTREDFWSRVHPDEVQTLRAALERHIEHGDPYREDVRIQARSGDYRWFYTRGQALWDESGKSLRIAGSITDITDRKTVEEELRKNEERYELVVAASGVGVWDWDLESGKVYLDGRIRAFLGYGPDKEWTHVDEFWENIHPDDVQGVREAYDRLFENNVPYNRDYRIRTRSGEYRWFNVRGKATRDETGKPVRVTGSGTDITEGRMSQEKLLRSEHRFRALMEQSPLPIVIYKPDGKIDQVNGAWLRQWGVNEEEAEEIKTTYNILEDEQLVDLGIDPLIKRAFSGENVVLPAIEYSGKRATGEVHLEHIKVKTVWVQVHLAPILNENREIIFIVVTNVDITALKRSEEEGHHQREALARVSRVGRMEQMTGSIAHELNQPLTGILSNAQAGEMMARAGKCDSGDMAEILAEIASDAKRASEVIQTLRSLYRKQKVEAKPVDINSLVKETEHLLHSEFIIQQIGVTTKCAPSPPMVAANRVQLQQVLVNLIMNAAEAMEDTAHPDGRLIRVATSHDKDELRAWVEDSGPGIDEEIIDTIFEPLATWKPAGTGMGLAISNSIIESHGGRMWAENRPEGGASVGFTLPSLKEEAKT